MVKPFMNTETGRCMMALGIMNYEEIQELRSKYNAFDPTRTVSSALVDILHNNLAIWGVKVLKGGYKNLIFRMGEDFVKALAEVKLNIKMDKVYNPDRLIMIEVPDGILKRDNSRGWYNYIAVMPHRVTETAIPHIFFIADDVSTQGDVMCIAGDDVSDLTLEEFIEGLTEGSPGANEELMVHNLKIAMNILVYLKSGDPDLREVRGFPTKHKGKHLDRYFASGRAFYPWDATQVGFDYKKPKLFSIDETSVMGHFRWQPYGQGRNLVKLIWIDEHIRKYNDDEAQA